jgi:hypothetical protein
MALTATTSLVPEPSSASRPLKSKSFTFDVDVVDRKASKPTKRTLEIRLAASNDLVFTGGSKSVTQDVLVGAVPVAVTFTTKISGTGDELAFFRVTLLDDAQTEMMACLVRLE